MEKQLQWQSALADPLLRPSLLGAASDARLVQDQIKALATLTEAI